MGANHHSLSGKRRSGYPNSADEETRPREIAIAQSDPRKAVRHDTLQEVQFSHLVVRNISTFVVTVQSKIENQKSKIPQDFWYVYILRCRDGSLYTGITTDLARRCEQHNSGRGARYTRGRGPVHVEYQEQLPTHSLALKREAEIKALPRRAKELLIARRAA